MPFFSISGSDFVEMFVGVGAARVRDMFEQAKKNAPCIVFIDEIDAVGRQRGAGLGGGNDEREQTLNQLLVEMDGFEGNAGVIVIAATNRPDVLDPALMRPGRFDRQVVVPLPDIRGREQILLVHMRKVPMADRREGGDHRPRHAGLLRRRSRQSRQRGRALRGAQEQAPGRHGRLRDGEGQDRDGRRAALDRDAGGGAAQHGVPRVGARDRRAAPAEDRPVHKVTIIPRGRALGVTMQLPEQDRYSMDRNHMLNVIAVLFGGRISEEIFMNQMTTGASNDFERATAHRAQHGHALRHVGPAGPDGLRRERGRSLPRPLDHDAQVNVSEETMRKVDGEIRKIIDQQYAVARKLIEDNRDKVEAMAKALLELETIDADQIDDIMAGLPPRPPKPSQSGSGAATPGAAPARAPRRRRTRPETDGHAHERSLPAAGGGQRPFGGRAGADSATHCSAPRCFRCGASRVRPRAPAA